MTGFAAVSLDDAKALENALIAYCTAVDLLDDVDGIAGLFTEDATLDLSGLHLPVFEGRGAIAGFYAKVFADMSHHMHMMSNFRVAEFAGETARCIAYVHGMGRSNAGVDISVFVWYDLDYRKTSQGWQISRFYEAPKLPMPESVTAVHAN